MSDQARVQPPSSAARGTIIRRRREALGWSQAQLAERVGTSQQTVDRLERGLVSHSRWLSPIQLELELPVGFVVAEINRSPSPIPRESRAFFEKLEADSDFPSGPIKVFAYDGLMLSTNPVFFTERPNLLSGVVGGYAIIADDPGMWPVFNTGDILYLNPRVPPRADNHVLLVSSDGASHKLATLLARRSGEWAVRGWTTEKETVLASAAWPTCHVVVGAAYR